MSRGEQDPHLGSAQAEAMNLSILSGGVGVFRGAEIAVIAVKGGTGAFRAISRLPAI